MMKFSEVVEEVERTLLARNYSNVFNVGVQFWRHEPDGPPEVEWQIYISDLKVNVSGETPESALRKFRGQLGIGPPMDLKVIDESVDIQEKLS